MMMTLIKILFAIYVLTCFICIFIKFYKLSGKHHKNLNTNANLYNINKPSLYKLEDKPTSRFGNKSIRSSARFHNDLFKTEEDYLLYRERVVNTKLP